MANVENVKMGTCSVVFKGVDLGHTKGGVTLHYEPDLADISVDQYGSTPVNKVLIGEKLSVTCSLAEVTLVNLHNAMTPSTISSGAQGTRVEIGSNSGQLLRGQAGLLRLHPIQNAANDLSEDVVIYNAVVSDTVEVAYTVEDQRVLDVTFNALIDETKVVGNRLGHIGVNSVS